MEQAIGFAGPDARTLKHIRAKARRLAHRGAIPGMAAEDIEQDLILDLWRRRGAFDPSRATFRTFADRIVVHRVTSLTSPTARTKGERHLVWLDAPTGDDDGRTLADTLADPGAATDLDLGLVLDVRRFMAGLTPAMRRCCGILLSPNLSAATADAGLHRSSVHENARRLRKLADAAGLREYVAAPRQSAKHAGKCPT